MGRTLLYHPEAIKRVGVAQQEPLCYGFPMISKTKKAKVLKEVQVHPTDTGSAEAQIGILTKRIEELALHLKKNNKDNHSRRGLLAMVADRQTHMKYLMKKNPKRFAVLNKKLGLKK